MEKENLVKGSALNNPGAVEAPHRNPATPKTPFIPTFVGTTDLPPPPFWQKV